MGDGVFFVGVYTVAAERRRGGFIGFFRFATDNVRRVADRRRTCGYGFDHDRIRANFRARTHRKTAQHLRTTTDNHARLQCWVAFRAALERCATERHALINCAIITNLGGLTNHDAHAMINEHAPPHRGTGVNFNPSEPTRDVRDKARQPIQFIQPQSMRQAVNRQCVKTGVAGNHFPR